MKFVARVTDPLGLIFFFEGLVRSLKGGLKLFLAAWGLDMILLLLASTEPSGMKDLGLKPCTLAWRFESDWGEKDIPIMSEKLDWRSSSPQSCSELFVLCSMSSTSSTAMSSKVSLFKTCLVSISSLSWCCLLCSSSSAFCDSSQIWCSSSILAHFSRSSTSYCACLSCTFFNLLCSFWRL